MAEPPINDSCPLCRTSGVFSKIFHLVFPNTSNKLTYDQIKAKIENGEVDIHAVDEQSETPINRAIFIDNQLYLRALLDSKANPNTKDSQGRTPLFKASGTGNLGCVELLLKRGAEVSLSNLIIDPFLCKAYIQQNPYRAVSKAVALSAVGITLLLNFRQLEESNTEAPSPTFESYFS